MKNSRLLVYRLLCAAFLSFFLSLFLAEYTFSTIKLDITQGVRGKVPILIEPVLGEPNIPRNYSNIIANDLTSSGVFSVNRKDRGLLDGEYTQEDYVAFRKNKLENILSGRIFKEDGKSKIQFVLHDIFGENSRRKWVTTLLPGIRISQIAHRISNEIYHQIIGEQGNFETHLAFVHSKRARGRNRNFSLYISDYDGFNPHPIANETDVITSPAWHPDLRYIAYVRFRSGIPSIILHELATNAKRNLSQTLGPGTSIAWSPSGEKLAYASYARGDSNIFTYNMKSKKVQQVTFDRAVDTEPSWASENILYFTSDRSGNPQIYRSDVSLNFIQRITMSGNYNTDVDVSPAGDRLAFLSQETSGNFSIYVRDLITGKEETISSGYLDESPKFMPNGRQVSCLSKRHGVRTVVIVNLEGKHEEHLQIPFDHVQQIAWSPLRTITKP